EQSAAMGECAGDADHLALGEGELSDGDAGVDVFAKAREEGSGFGEHFSAVEEEAGEARFAADEDVVLGIEMREGDGFLMDGGNTPPRDFFGGADVAEGEGIAVEEDAAGIGGDGAGEDFDEGGFSGAVFAAEGVDFAGGYVEGDVIKRADAGVGFAYAFDADQ